MYSIGGPAAIKAAHLALPVLCMTMGYAIAGTEGFGIAVLTLITSHVSRYADKSTWKDM